MNRISSIDATRGVMLLIMFVRGFHWTDLNFGPFGFGRPAAPNGLELGGVYLIWIAVVITLYPLCDQYGKFKERRKDIGWLKYF